MAARTLLVSFADGMFKTRHAKFASQARATGFFDDVFMYNMQTLLLSFLCLHRLFLERNPRGFGYWIWKPVVILDALQAARTDDIIIYLDAGFTLNSGGRRRFDEYIEVARDSEFGMLSFQNIFTESHWTKADLANRLNIKLDSIYMRTSQLGSGFIVLKPTADNLDLIHLWQEISVESDYHYSDDSTSVIENHPDFREHRHDQSISSGLIGTDESCWGFPLTSAHASLAHAQGHIHHARRDGPAAA